MSETFTFDVDYRTTFSDLEKLREQMLAFVTAEKRDFQPAFDVSVQGTSIPSHRFAHVRHMHAVPSGTLHSTPSLNAKLSNYFCPGFLLTVCAMIVYRFS